MPLLALILALGSAVLHAAWNLLLGRARDVQAAAAATFVLSILVALPFALIWWHADISVWPYALASTVLEAVYVVALALAYRRSEVAARARIRRAATLAVSIAGYTLRLAGSALVFAGIALLAV